MPLRLPLGAGCAIRRGFFISVPMSMSMTVSMPMMMLFKMLFYPMGYRSFSVGIKMRNVGFYIENRRAVNCIKAFTVKVPSSVEKLISSTVDNPMGLGRTGILVANTLTFLGL